jgi:hypothetical protein
MRALKEKDGSPFCENVFNAANNTITTVDYNLPRPGTTEPVPNESYIVKVGNQGRGVGYYKI